MLLSSITFILALLHSSRGRKLSFLGLSMSSILRRSLLGNPQNFRQLFCHLHYHLCKFLALTMTLIHPFHHSWNLLLLAVLMVTMKLIQVSCL